MALAQEAWNKDIFGQGLENIFDYRYLVGFIAV